MKARRGRENADDQLLLALACGETVENAAKKAGVSSRTAHRRLNDPEFCKRLGKIKANMVKRATSMLNAAATEAAKTLMSLQEISNPPAVRLGAARTILEFGIKLRENNEILERIEALETQLEIP